jgi:Coenzyme PQQ synthesis protein D (PqqD)
MFDREQAERFAIIDRMRAAFADVPPEQIERDVAAIIRELRDKDEAVLRELDKDSAECWQILEAMRAPFRGVPTEEIEREASKAIAEVRAERRAAREAAAKSA